MNIRNIGGNGLSRVDKYEIRKSVVDLLRFLKRHYRYKELSAITDLHITALSRYKQGYIFPNYFTSMQLYLKLKPLLMKQIRKIIFDNDASEIFRPEILKILAKIILYEIVGRRVTKILAFEDMAPLATAVSLQTNVPFVLITTMAKTNYGSYLIIPIPVGDIYINYYLPRKMINSKDDILFVDLEITEIKKKVLEKIEEAKKIEITKKIILKEFFKEENLNKQII